MKTLWSQEYAVTSFLVNSQKKLGLCALLNLIQDMAWGHIDLLGYGYAHRPESLWILAQQVLEMREWPSWGEKVEMRTWLRHPARATALRDFEIWCNGRQIGDASARYVTLDATTRRLVSANMPEELLEHRSSPLTPEKVPVLTGLAPLATYDARNSDLDFHGHVNNTRYAQWILDSLPLDLLQRREVSGYEVSFLAEVCAGDRIVIQSRPLSENHMHFQGWRAKDDTVVFTARLQARG